METGIHGLYIKQNLCINTVTHSRKLPFLLNNSVKEAKTTRISALEY